MKKIALIGAGGKMGCRVSKNLLNRVEYEVSHVENSPAGVERLKALGLAVKPAEVVIAGADIVVFALPDRLIGKLGAEFVPLVRPGGMVVLLDPAAAYAGVLPKRPDIAYFVSHPCHPPLFNDETRPEARSDWFGGQGLAKQDIVCAVHQGDDAVYREGEELAKAMFAPVMRAYRVTVEQMAVLEPALVETFTSTLVDAMKKAMDRAVQMGIPREAAQAFLMGHVRIQFAVIFGYADFPFSDGAYLAMSKAGKYIFKPDWLDNVMDLANVRASVKDITDSLESSSVVV